MTKNKKKDNLELRDMASVIEEAIRQLPNGDFRLSVSRFPLSNVCLAGFGAPDIQEQILSDYSMPLANEEIAEIAEQFYEEITMIEKIMDEMNITNRLNLDASHRKAYAMRMWDCYAIPWRFHNKAVHLIWAPHDFMGTPIIHSYPVSYFLCTLAGILEKNYGQAWKHASHLKYWKIFGLALIIIGLIVWAVIGK
jgi:hypothetical protein